MSLRDYIKNMTEEQLVTYAQQCGTSVAYIKTHLLSARKTPKINLLHALSDNSEGNVSEIDVLIHFGLLKSVA